MGCSEADRNPAAERGLHERSSATIVAHDNASVSSHHSAERFRQRKPKVAPSPAVDLQAKRTSITIQPGCMIHGASKRPVR